MVYPAVNRQAATLQAVDDSPVPELVQGQRLRRQFFQAVPQLLVATRFGEADDRDMVANLEFRIFDLAHGAHAQRVLDQLYPEQGNLSQPGGEVIGDGAGVEFVAATCRRQDGSAAHDHADHLVLVCLVEQLVEDTQFLHAIIPAVVIKITGFF